MATIHFYLVRHGQTRLNRSRRLQGTTNSPLTKKGKRMAKRLGKELQNIRFTAVYTSDLKRTHETAELILSENKRGCPPVYRDPDLRELSFGKFEEANNMAVIPTALRTLGLRKILRAFANDEHVAELTELFRTMDGEEEGKLYAVTTDDTGYGVVLESLDGGKDIKLLQADTELLDLTDDRAKGLIGKWTDNSGNEYKLKKDGKLVIKSSSGETKGTYCVAENADGTLRLNLVISGGTLEYVYTLSDDGSTVELCSPGTDTVHKWTKA